MTGLLRFDRLVTPEWVGPGWLEVDGERIGALGPGEPPRPARYAGHTGVAGFVDLHVHGGGGHDYSEVGGRTGLGPARAAAAHHLRRGTTTTLASLVSDGPAELLDRVGLLAGLVEDGVLAGLHLEGPWLAAGRAGAHRPELLRDPDPAELAALLAVGRGTVRMITLAPERPGALAAVRRMTSAGVLAAVGHTDADYETVRAALRAGARVGTHLFNAMRPVHHREPGPVVALLEDPRVTVELILDGRHVHPALYRRVLADAGPERLALVTDAMAAAGRPDGDYRLGGLEVTVAGGAAHLTGTGTIAGGTADMAEVFACAVRHSGLPEPEALRTATRVTSATPARLLGLADRGTLRAGLRADLVVLDGDLSPAGVLRGGSWVAEASGVG
jgi:N-acetylglucosamine-6-phosphate deacetylase